jgi:hypothetical protein
MITAEPGHDDTRAKRLSGQPAQARHGEPVSALLDSGTALAGGAGARFSSGARQADVGAAPRVSRHPGAGGRHRRILCPPRGIALVRAQRGERAALPLSRLEIRCCRPMRRSSLRARGERFLQKDQAQVLSMHRIGRCHLGLHGAAAFATALACFRMDAGPAFPPFHFQAHAGMQSSASDGRRHRLRPRVVPAPPRPAQRFAAYRRRRRADARTDAGSGSRRPGGGMVIGVRRPRGTGTSTGTSRSGSCRSTT